jgi:hypothetical protein
VRSRGRTDVRLVGAGGPAWALWATVALAGVLLAGCSARSSAVSSGTVPDISSTADCSRSILGDTKTASRHLQDGRPETAIRYVEWLSGCPGALQDLGYLEVAIEVSEAAGTLNQAWRFWARARAIAKPQDDGKLLGRLESWYSEFRGRYVLIELMEGAKPPQVDYAGPFVDERTRRQLDAIERGDSVTITAGRVGFWLLPGRYSVSGEVRTLTAGSSVAGKQ